MLKSSSKSSISILSFHGSIGRQLLVVQGFGGMTLSHEPKHSLDCDPVVEVKKLPVRNILTLKNWRLETMVWRRNSTLHPCLASMARLNQRRFLNPSPPSSFLEEEYRVSKNVVQIIKEQNWGSTKNVYYLIDLNITPPIISVSMD